MTVGADALKIEGQNRVGWRDSERGSARRGGIPVHVSAHRRGQGAARCAGDCTLELAEARELHLARVLLCLGSRHGDIAMTSHSSPAPNASRPNLPIPLARRRRRRPPVKLETNWTLVAGQTDLWKTELELEQERSQRMAARSVRRRKTGLYSFFGVVAVAAACLWVVAERAAAPGDGILPIQFAEVPMLVDSSSSVSK